MPRKPKKPCKHPGCPRLVEGTYCEEHALLHGQERGDSAVRGYDSKWRKARERFLKLILSIYLYTFSSRNFYAACPSDS